jgi:hypothetical protein
MSAAQDLLRRRLEYLATTKTVQEYLEVKDALTQLEQEGARGEPLFTTREEQQPA